MDAALILSLATRTSSYRQRQVASAERRWDGEGENVLPGCPSWQALLFSVCFLGSVSLKKAPSKHPTPFPLLPGKHSCLFLPLFSTQVLTEQIVMNGKVRHKNITMNLGKQLKTRKSKTSD